MDDSGLGLNSYCATMAQRGKVAQPHSESLVRGLFFQNKNLTLPRMPRSQPVLITITLFIMQRQRRHEEDIFPT